MSHSKLLRCGFAQVDITPKKSACLAGYFNKRTSNSVLDNLYVKLCLLRSGNKKVIIIYLDLISTPVRDVDNIRTLLHNKYAVEKDSVFVCSTHTHTAPAVKESFEVKRENEYISKTVYPSILKAFRLANRRLRECEVYRGHVKERGLAFNRRYWMKDGTVLTNPPKGSRDLVKPEGPVDHSVTVLEFVAHKRTLGAIVNVTNHTDTIGGNKISADWPGHMCQEINTKKGKDCIVLLLNGTAGNINHYDPERKGSQTSYSESKRIGKAYAGYVLEAIKNKKHFNGVPLNVISKEFNLSYRKVSTKQIQKAEQIIKYTLPIENKNLTACELAKGDSLVEQLYAGQLIKFQERRRCSGDDPIYIIAFRIGEVAVVGLPGEPFVEIGLEIKRKSPFKYTLVSGNTNGAVGYVPLRKHFKNGGYETLTTLGNRFNKRLGYLMINESTKILEKLKGK